MSVRQVLTIGEVGVDWIVRVPALPTRGGNVWCPAPELYGGGATANVAVGLARLGVPVSFWGKVGDDEHGHFLVEDLEREGVDTSFVRVVTGAPTMVVVAIVDAEGERTFLTCSLGAAHTKLNPEEIEPHAIAAAAWLHTSGTCLAEAPSQDAILRAMALARDLRVPVSLDVNVCVEREIIPAPFRAAVERAVSLADVVLGSAQEIAALAPASSIEESAQFLAQEQRTVIARQGPAGALAVSSAGVMTVPAFPTPVVDTVGAGDAFDAGFIAACVSGLDLEAALRWGNAVAALKIARAGARGLPRRADVEELLHG
jgi:fructokinase/2-dehydro-3-deoxygluconokinase